MASDLLETRVEELTPQDFPNIFFAVFHNSLVLRLFYCCYKSFVAKKMNSTAMMLCEHRKYILLYFVKIILLHRGTF